MGIDDIDNDLYNKMDEVFKIILRDKSTKISFEPVDNKDDLLELTVVSLNEHNFKIYALGDVIIKDTLSEKYKKFHSKLVTNKWFLLCMIPFLGNPITKSKTIIKSYRIFYNNIIFEMEKSKYDKMMYYIKYVFRVQQLLNLNNVLGIKKKFDIIFDEDEVASDFFKEFYENFKDIIKPSRPHPPNGGA